MTLPKPLGRAAVLAIGRAGAPPPPVSFSMEPQQLENWCWAAVALAVLRHHLPAWAARNQCDVASALFRMSDCCTHPENYNSAEDARLAVDAVDGSVLKREPQQALDPDQVEAVFNGGGVVACHISYDDGRAHWLALGDIQGSGAAPLVRVFDPDPHLHDSVVWMSIDEVKNYGGGHWDTSGTSATFQGQVGT